jgi:hypothetical protein
MSRYSPIAVSIRLNFLAYLTSKNMILYSTSKVVASHKPYRKIGIVAGASLTVFESLAMRENHCQVLHVLLRNMLSSLLWECIPCRGAARSRGGCVHPCKVHCGSCIRHLWGWRAGVVSWIYEACLPINWQRFWQLSGFSGVATTSRR